MKERTQTRIKSEIVWTRRYAFAWDFKIAMLLGLGAGLAAEFDDSLRKSAHLLDVSAALGVAFLAVVIGSVSILTVFLTEDYGILLRAKYDDVGEVFYPYRLVALLSCATTAVAVFGLFIWPSCPPWAKATLLGISLAFAAWTTIGAFDLVRITAAHARLKMRLPEVTEAYKREREKRAS